MKYRTALLALSLAALALSSAAQERVFPAHALRGKMTPLPFPEVAINGKVRRLAPGARIFGDDNLIKMPASLRGSALTVNYELDGNGEVVNVWLLTAEEAAAPAPDKMRRQAGP